MLLFQGASVMTFTRSQFSPVEEVPMTDRLKAGDVHSTLRQHMLVDGFDFVVDLARSQGTRLHDSRSGKTYLDFFSFFASAPIGFNHPKMFDQGFLETLIRTAVNKPSSSDAYTVEMAEFVETFFRLAAPSYFKHLFLIEGGALAVENTLKTAFDWKVRKNFERGETTEKGHTIIHFRHAFHGRSGYTLSLTNTDPNKVKYFPRFTHWPRITNPSIRFPMNEENLMITMAEEQLALKEIEDAFIEHRNDIAAIIIEPIQAEGGDNHFRPEFLQALRTIADENEVLLIFDEVQTGVGMTGKMWAHEWFGVQPDLMSFGKKMQVCGMLSTGRVDDIADNVFHKPGRINSTWGGNLVDMMRAKRYLEIIHEDNLVENARVQGEHLLQDLHKLSEEFPQYIANVRGRGLFCAMDLPNETTRLALREKSYERRLVLIGCGDHSIRFRPPLTITRAEIEEGVSIIRECLKEM
jgi:L-lysine 6-transaminase